MKIPKLPLRKKVHASTARRSIGPSDEMDYEEMSEPNMKLSRALLIVLVLHVVAVAGIIAFNTIKSRQGTFPPPSAAASAAPAKSNPASAPPNDASAAAPAMAANEAPLPRREEVKPAPAGPMKIVGKEEPTKVAKALPVEPDSGKFYIVAKGDNPVSIAKKLKVSQGELLSANNITDPTKLQIGQKLIVPTKTTTAKASPKSKATDR
jgi:LysM repeat protein